MAAEKTFSRINAGESMAFPGRFIRCVQHPQAKGAPTIAGTGKTWCMDAGYDFAGMYLQRVSEQAVVIHVAAAAIYSGAVLPLRSEII